MIDWLTAHVRFNHEEVSEFWALFCQSRWSGWMRLEKGGEIAGVKFEWRRMRSDAREVTIVPRGDGFTVCGSPSSANGDPNNVFGTCDPQEALDSMVDAAFEVLAVEGWKFGREWVESVRVTRADVTFNVLLPSAGHVGAILRGIGGIQTGRYRTGRKYGTTVYLGGKSRVRKSKIYQKGAHIRSMIQKGKLRGLPEADLELLDRVARLELEFGRDWFDGKSWEQAKRLLESEAVVYWSGLWGDLESVAMEKSELDRIVECALMAGLKERTGKAVFRTLALIRSQGRESAELSLSRATWYRHQRLLREAGFGEAELHGGCVVYRFPVREVLARRVDSWEELRKAA